MRNRRQTIEALRRLAERPGTKHEGETARRMLAKMIGNAPQAKPFRIEDFPNRVTVYYNYWGYPENDPCVVCHGKRDIASQFIDGNTWMRLRFTHLKQPRWVPVTSAKGCHISKHPLSPKDSDYMNNGMTTLNL
jgi:hypothetical protein